MHEIKHVVVLMMENHSFDNLLGMVPHQVPGRAALDGLTVGWAGGQLPTRRSRPSHPGATAQLALPAPGRAQPGLERQPRRL